MKVVKKRVNRRNRIHVVDLIFGERQPITTDLNTQGSEDVIGWKGGFYIKHNIKTGIYEYIPVLIKLLIPKYAFRTAYSNPDNAKYSKHRCSEAKVLGFYSYYTGREIKYLNGAYSFFGTTVLENEPFIGDEMYTCSFKTIFFEYFKNRIALPNCYDRGLSVCSNGIHYFYEKQSALLYLDQEVPGWCMKPRYNSFWSIK